MKIGNLFILGFHGYALPEWLLEFEKRFGLGGVILFDYYTQTKKYENNIQNPAQVRRLCQSVHQLASKPMVFIDQEGGKVRRLKQDKGFQNFPSQLQFNNLSKAAKTAACNSSFRELKDLGIDYNLTPVIDLNLNPENSDIGKVERSYSDKPEEVRQNVKVLAAVAKDFGLKLCLKHFPGVGGSKQNSHHELTDLSDSLSEEQENLFYELAPQIPGETVLISHGIVKQWEEGKPVSLSPVGIGRIRAKLPKALLISDDMQMQGLQLKHRTAEACVRGLLAGLDMVLIGNNMINEESACISYAEGVLAAAGKDAKFAALLGAAEQRVLARK